MHRVGEQPVAPAHAEGPDGVLLHVVVDAVAAVLDVALEVAPLRREVVQCLAQQALRQHAVQVGQQQRLNVGQHRDAVLLAPAPEFSRVDAVAPGQRLDVVRLAYERDEARREPVRPALVLRQGLQRFNEGKRGLTAILTEAQQLRCRARGAATRSPRATWCRHRDRCWRCAR